MSNLDETKYTTEELEEMKKHYESHQEEREQQDRECKERQDKELEEQAEKERERLELVRKVNSYMLIDFRDSNNKKCQICEYEEAFTPCRVAKHDLEMSYIYQTCMNCLHFLKLENVDEDDARVKRMKEYDANAMRTMEEKRQNRPKQDNDDEPTLLGYNAEL